jgi:hypothetical protein
MKIALTLAVVVLGEGMKGLHVYDSSHCIPIKNTLG